MRFNFGKLVETKAGKMVKNAVLAVGLLLGGAAANEAFSNDVEALEAPKTSLEVVEASEVSTVEEKSTDVVKETTHDDALEKTSVISSKAETGNVQTVTPPMKPIVATNATKTTKVIANAVTKPETNVSVKETSTSTEPTVEKEEKKEEPKQEPKQETETTVSEEKPVTAKEEPKEEVKQEEKKGSSCSNKNLKKDPTNPLHQVNSKRDCLILEAIQLEREGIDSEIAWQFYREFEQGQHPAWVVNKDGRFVYTKEYYAMLLESTVRLQNEVRQYGAENMTNVADHVKPEDFNSEIKNLVNKLNNAPGLTPYIIGVNHTEALAKQFGVEQASNDWFNSPMNNPLVRTEGKFERNYYFENPLLIELYGTPENVRIENEVGNPSAQEFLDAHPIDTTQDMIEEKEEASEPEVIVSTPETTPETPSEKVNNSDQVVNDSEDAVMGETEDMNLSDVKEPAVKDVDVTETETEKIEEAPVTTQPVVELSDAEPVIEPVDETVAEVTETTPAVTVVLSEDSQQGGSEDLIF